jgi:predicted N-formylglutamate amidohydrolase
VPRNDAVEIAGAPRPGRLLFTCEHASNRVPPPWRPRPRDAALLRDHWGYDIGARRVTLALRRRFGGCAVLSRFSRLLLDPNREPSDPTLVLVDTGEGRPSFNARVDLAERVARFHQPFHAAVDACAKVGPRGLISIHSFTPVFRGEVRQVEAGVLFDDHEALAGALNQALREQGLDARENEPYSGKAGLIYSAARHGRAAGIPYLEIELRQDLVASRRGSRAISAKVGAALEAVFPSSEKPAVA